MTYTIWMEDGKNKMFGAREMAESSKLILEETNPGLTVEIIETASARSGIKSLMEEVSSARFMLEETRGDHESAAALFAGVVETDTTPVGREIERLGKIQNVLRGALEELVAIDESTSMDN